MKKIEVVWRGIKTKTFRGPDAEKNAEAFCNALCSNYMVEQPEAFELQDGSATAYFEIGNNFHRVDMDG